MTMSREDGLRWLIEHDCRLTRDESLLLVVPKPVSFLKKDYKPWPK